MIPIRYRLQAAHDHKWRPPGACPRPGLLVAAIAAFALAACDEVDERPSIAAGNAQRGSALIEKYGCGACHTIPGIDGANGLVGPPLDRIASRIYIAGVLRNSPDSMAAWLREPQSFVPGNAMPNMGLDEQDARDVTAYLYRLR